MKKNVLLLVLLWVGVAKLQAQVFPIETILNNGIDGKRIKFVFLSDGYKSDQLPDFITRVNNFKDFLFTQPPYSNYKNFFNLYAIKVPSVESGADHPKTATDEGTNTQPVLVADTYFNTTFDFANIHRLVVPQNVSGILNVMASNFPNYNQIFIFSNSTYYGGSGGTFATATADGSSNEVAVHEIGHSFANLADEYTIGGQGEKANRTKETNPALIKWKNWIGSENIGIFPVGIEDWQRPHQNCKMQFLGVPFCAVCKEAILDKIYKITTPIYSFLPTAVTVPLSSNKQSKTAATTNFSIVLTLPIPNTLSTVWKLNGTTIATGVNNVDVAPAQLIAGNNTLTAFVTDNSLLSRSYLPEAGYVFSKSWTLTSAAPLPLKLLSFNVKEENSNAKLTWTTAEEENVANFEIQKSIDGKSFETIGNIKAVNSKEKTEYQFYDKALLSGTSYYRLQQFYNDAKSSFSAIKALNKTDKLYYNISPNPVADLLTVAGKTDYETDITIDLIDETGKQVYQKRMPNVNGEYKDLIDVKSFNAGVYILNLNLNNGFIKQGKIMVVH